MRYIGWCIIGVMVSVAAGQTTGPAGTEPARGFTLGKETTRIVEPLLADGRPDYVGAVNEELSKGVTPENNALVGLLEVIGTGPEVIVPRVREEALRRLGMKGDGEGAKFERLDAYLKRVGKAYDDAMQDEETYVRSQVWEEKDHPVIAKWVEGNSEVLDRVVKVAGREHYYWPWVRTTDRAGLRTACLPALMPQRQAAEGLMMRAMLRLGRGDIKGSESDLLAAHRLGRLESQGDTVIEKLVGMAVDGMTSRADAALAGKLDGVEARAYLAELEKLPAMHGVSESIDVGERYCGLDGVLSVKKYGLGAVGSVIDRTVGKSKEVGPEEWERRDVDWDKVLKRMNECYDGDVRALGKRTFAERKLAAEAVDRQVGEVRARAAQEVVEDVTERMGDAVISMLMMSVGRAGELEDRRRERFELGVVAVALAAYRGEKGEWPERLEELAPGYLKVVPGDVFVDGPLKYRREGKGCLVYSVGPEMRDHGGVAGKTEAVGDMVVRLER